MSSPELVLEFVKTLVWPIVVSFVLIRYHPQLSDLIQRITKIRFPGGGELDAEVKNITAKVSEQTPPSSERYIPRETGTSILERVESDPTLALAELRMQLEQVLRAMHKIGSDTSNRRRPMNLAALIRELQQTGDLPSELAGSLRDVISITNRAVHGERVSQEAAKSLVDVGVRLLKELKWLYGEKVSKPVDTFVISNADCDRLMEGTQYKVTTAVPLAENPIVNIRILDQAGLDELLNGYDEYAEFLIAVEPLDSDLPQRK